jgi:hypothetical protein
MYTTNTDEDFAYNRQFQVMKYLVESDQGSDPFLNAKD